MNTDIEAIKQLLLAISQDVKKMVITPYDTRWKEDNTPVTDIDMFVTHKVTAYLKEQYPDDGIFGEEEAQHISQSGYTWVLDSIDGTQVLGMLPTSTICLARVGQNGLPLFSVIVNPLTDELFYTDESNCFRNGEKMSVSHKDVIKGSYIFLGSRMPKSSASNGKIYDSIESEGGKVLNIRSLAYSCVLVACGKAEGAYIGVSTPFEAASVKLLVEKAGGRVTDLRGNTPERYDGVIDGLIVSNGTQTIHNKLVEFILQTN